MIVSAEGNEGVEEEGIVGVSKRIGGRENDLSNACGVLVFSYIFLRVLYFYTLTSYQFPDPIY